MISYYFFIIYCSQHQSAASPARPARGCSARRAAVRAAAATGRRGRGRPCPGGAMPPEPRAAGRSAGGGEQPAQPERPLPRETLFPRTALRRLRSRVLPEDGARERPRRDGGGGAARAEAGVALSPPGHGRTARLGRGEAGSRRRTSGAGLAPWGGGRPGSDRSPALGAGPGAVRFPQSRARNVAPWAGRPQVGSARRGAAAAP